MSRSDKKKANQNKKPIAVLISDVHYNINTLEVANTALKQAVDKTWELDLPLVICGDLHDTKANIRGECIKAMMETLSQCRYHPIILRGNHDSINEKSNEHSLEFLRESCFIVSLGLKQYTSNLDEEIKLGWFIPYQHDPDVFRQLINLVPKDSIVFMHQGVQNTNSGHYFQDKSAIPKEWLAGRRVISGHYHTKQNIKLADGGLLSYVGNPYTLGFGEANDPEKGYQILYEDGSLEFIPTNLRRHQIIEVETNGTDKWTWSQEPVENSILWVKVSGSSDYLSTLTKSEVASYVGIKQDFKLDLIPYPVVHNNVYNSDLSHFEIMNGLIDSLTNTSEQRKLRLKLMYKETIK